MTPGFMTRTDAGSFLTDGFAIGQQVVIGGSALNGGKTFTISNVTAKVVTFSAGDTIHVEASAGTAENVSLRRAATITRIAGDWTADGFVVGQSISVSGSAANRRVSASRTRSLGDGGCHHAVAQQYGRERRQHGSGENGVAVSHNATITRTTGDWMADGFAVGSTISVAGSAAEFDRHR